MKQKNVRTWNETEMKEIKMATEKLYIRYK